MSEVGRVSSTLYDFFTWMEEGLVSVFGFVRSSFEAGLTHFAKSSASPINSNIMEWVISTLYDLQYNR